MPSRNPDTPHPSQPALELKPEEVEILAFIQSNKFITPKLYNRRFIPGQTYKTACKHLSLLRAKGLLLGTQSHPREDTYFSLSRPALKQLSGLARILTSPEIRSPHINPFEREHDKRVLTLRIQIEAQGGLESLTWLSDYEMRCGLRWEWKKALEEGSGWDLAGRVKPHRVHHRIPDGYFEGVLQGQAYSFVLEYEHTPYNRDKMTAMVLNLTRDFPSAFRLIVSRDKPHAIRMMRGLETFLRTAPGERSLWGFNYFEKVDRLPFTQVPWAKLDGGYLPFVKDPILTIEPPAEPKKETA